MAKKEQIAFPTDKSDYCVAVLYTTEQPERLAWLLDDAFSSAFWLLENPLETNVQKNISTHLVFYSSPKHEEANYWLVAEAGPLAKLRPKADYLLVIKAENAMELMEIRLAQIKLIQTISLAHILSEETKNTFSWLHWLQESNNSDSIDSNE